MSCVPTLIRLPLLLLVTAILQVIFIAPAWACIPGSPPELCPEATLKLATICLEDEATAAWKVTNSNSVSIDFVAAVDCADEQLANRLQYLTVPAGGEVEFVTPTVEFGCLFGPPTVSIYSFGRRDDQQTFPSKILDQCGVCGGEDSALGCDGACFSGKKFDRCQVCGGDGSTCDEDECEEQSATAEELISAKRVRRAARTLVTRTRQFSRRAATCDGSDLSKFVRRAERIYRRLAATLETKFTNSTLVCDSSVCSTESTGELKRSLKKLAKKLANVQRTTKSRSIEACRIPDVELPLNRKDTTAYLRDLLNAVSNLAGEKLSCS